MLISRVVYRRRLVQPPYVTTFDRRSSGGSTHALRQGSQFRSARSSIRLVTTITGYMGRVGACGDNTAIESFFALVKRNALDRHGPVDPGTTTIGDRHLDRGRPTTASDGNADSDGSLRSNLRHQ